MSWLIAKLIRFSPKLIPIFFAFSLGFSAMVIVSAWPHADVSYDRTLDVYRQILGVGLDDEAVFIQGADIDVFYGAKTEKSVRYPILGDFPWALRKADFLIEPRLLHILEKPTGVNGIALAAYQAGMTVITPNHDIAMATTAVTVEARGIHWVASRKIKKSVSIRTLDAALKICKILESVNYSLPKMGHYYTRQIFEFFRFPFYSAARYLEEMGKKDQHELALKVAFGLYHGENPQTWIDGCQTLQKENLN